MDDRFEIFYFDIRLAKLNFHKTKKIQIILK